VNTRRIEPFLPPCRRLAGRLFACVLSLFAGAAAAQAEDTLLAAMTTDLRAPQLRCEWIAGEFDTLERTLSLYREELASIYVAVDGRTIGDSAGGAIVGLEFESRRTGPAGMAVALDASRVPAQPALAAGQRIEAWFTDRAGQPYPLFCGVLAALRADAATRRIDLLAVLPRTGDLGRSDARFANASCVDVLKRLAAAAGLGIKAEDRRQREIFPLIERKQLADWPFIRQLANQCDYEIAFSPGGTLRVTDSAFPPPAAARRQWSDVTLAEIAKQIARSTGRELDARLTASYPRVDMIQVLPDADFLASAGITFQVSAWFEPGRVILAEDGVWQTPPAPVAALMAGIAPTPDELQLRITIAGNADNRRSFTRLRSDRALRQGDPERVPVVQTTLLLGRAMRAAEPPRFELAGHAATMAALDGALARLERYATLTPERRFLIGYARSHHPTLLHVYRVQPGGIQALEAIGR